MKRITIFLMVLIFFPGSFYLFASKNSVNKPGEWINNGNTLLIEGQQISNKSPVLSGQDGFCEGDITIEEPVSESTFKGVLNELPMTSEGAIQSEAGTLSLLPSYFKKYTYNSTNKYNVSSDVCDAYSGGFVIVGGTAAAYGSGGFPTNPSIYLLKIDNSGNEVWKKNYTISGSTSSMAMSICQTTGNCYYVAGAYNLFQTTPPGFVFKIDANGNIVGTTKTFSTGYGVSVISSIDGGCVVAGVKKINATPPGDKSRVFVKKFNSSLGDVWTWLHSVSSSSSQAEYNESWTYSNNLLEVPLGYDGAGNIIFAYTHNDNYWYNPGIDCFPAGWLVCLDRNTGKIECDSAWTPPAAPNGGNPSLI